MKPALVVALGAPVAKKYSSPGMDWQLKGDKDEANRVWKIKTFTGCTSNNPAFNIKICFKVKFHTFLASPTPQNYLDQLLLYLSTVIII